MHKTELSLYNKAVRFSSGKNPHTFMLLHLYLWISEMLTRFIHVGISCCLLLSNREHCQQPDNDPSSYLWRHSDFSQWTWAAIRLLFSRTGRWGWFKFKFTLYRLKYWKKTKKLTFVVLCVLCSCWCWFLVLSYDTALRDAGTLSC